MLTEKDNYFNLISDKDIPKKAVDEYCQGEILLQEEKYEEAIICYDTAISLAPKYVHAYLSKYNALNKLLKNKKDISHLKETITCLNKCILFGPISPTPLYMKGKFYLSNHQTSSAIHCFKQALLLVPREMLVIETIAKCYYIIGNYSKAEQFYKMTISSSNEYTSDPMEMMKKVYNIDRIPLKTKKLDNTNYYEATYFEPNIRAEMSSIYENMQYYSKSLTEINKAISDSKWAEYYLQRIAVYKKIIRKWGINKFNDRIVKDLETYYNICLCVDDNRHLMLYSLIKSKVNPNKNINWDMLPLLFLEFPQSIIDIFKINPNVANDIIIQCHSSATQIEDFSILMDYFGNVYGENYAVRKRAILHCFLGGIASAFYLFDEKLDNEEEFLKLTSIEMYYYSKVAKIVGLDFEPIINSNIISLNNRDKSDIDYYYLGQMYLLKDDKVSAKSCFEQSQKNAYSNIMLSYLNKDIKHVKNIDLSKLKILYDDIDINNGLSQFYKYFHLVECGEAIEYCCYFNDDEIRDLIYRPIWEIFHLSDSSKNIMMNKLKWKSIERILKISTSNNIYDEYKEDLQSLIHEIDIYEDKLTAISNYCKRENVKGENVLRLTQYYYLSQTLNLDDFIALNLYYLSYIRIKKNINITKTIVYSFISSYSLYANYWAVIMSILFYILDNNTGTFKMQEVNFYKYREKIKLLLFDDWHYINIKKLLEQYTIVSN